jgi:molecular chaperone DnaJ
MLGTFSQVTTCRSCSGSGQIVEHPCLVCQGQGLEKKQKSINVEIPKGVDKGMKLRVVGEGNQGEHGGPPGDLYVFITVTEHQYFRREADDIYLEVEVPLSQAILGTKIEVPVIGGQAYIKIPEGTQSGTAFRLKGKGMSRVRGFGSGDQYVTVNVKIPKNISKKEKQLIEEFGSLRDENKSEKAVVKRLY